MSGGAAYDQLDALYDVWCAEVAEDVPFYVGLARSLAHEFGRESLDVVELGAGSGRITQPLLEGGHRVVAIDASERQLARLEARVAQLEGDTGDRATVVGGDMRELASLVEPGTADLIVAPFRSLLHVTRDRDRVLAAAAQVLRPGGALAFDVFHPDRATVSSTDERWMRRRVHSTRTGRWRFDERARYREIDPGAAEISSSSSDGDEIPLLLDVDVRCRWSPVRRSMRRASRSMPAAAAPGAPMPDGAIEDPGEAEPHEVWATLELQVVSAGAWRRSLERAGLEVDGAYGWFDARPLGPDDEDSAWVARRPR